MPELPTHREPTAACEICGRPETPLEMVQGHWICVDHLGCISRGLDTAKELGRRIRRQEQLEMWRADDE